MTQITHQIGEYRIVQFLIDEGDCVSSHLTRPAAEAPVVDPVDIETLGAELFVIGFFNNLNVDNVFYEQYLSDLIVDVVCFFGQALAAIVSQAGP